MFCKKCGCRIPLNASGCPECGAELPETEYCAGFWAELNQNKNTQQSGIEESGSALDQTVRMRQFNEENCEEMEFAENLEDEGEGSHKESDHHEDFRQKSGYQEGSIQKSGHDENPRKKPGHHPQAPSHRKHFMFSAAVAEAFVIILLLLAFGILAVYNKGKISELREENRSLQTELQKAKIRPAAETTPAEVPALEQKVPDPDASGSNAAESASQESNDGSGNQNTIKEKESGEKDAEGEDSKEKEPGEEDAGGEDSKEKVSVTKNSEEKSSEEKGSEEKNSEEKNSEEKGSEKSGSEKEDQKKDQGKNDRKKNPEEE